MTVYPWETEGIVYDFQMNSIFATLKEKLKEENILLFT